MASGAAQAVFTTGSLLGHVTRMSFTASIGLMAIFAVDLVDMIFISMLGNAALAAAVGYAGTVMFFTNAVSIGLSIAAGTLVAQAIGAGRVDEARHRATSVAIYAAIVGLIIPITALVNLNYILGLLGASGETLPLARSYLTILLPTSAFLGVAMTAMAVLRAYGDAKRSMYATLFGGIANAVLDPIFIFALGLGLEGAAIASVIARIVVFYYAIAPAIRIHDGFAWPNLARVAGDTRAVAGIAGPAVLANIATPVGSAIVLRQMAQHGTDAVAGMAIIGRLVPVAFSVIFALSGAIGPIIGQNFGAKLLDRVHDAYLDALKFAVIYVLGAALILFLARGLLADAFGVTGQARDLLFIFSGPLALAYIFNGAIFVSNAAFNNLGHPLYSTLVNWGTCTLGTLPFVMAGSALYGAPGILIGQACGTALFAIGAVVVALRLTRAPDPEKEAPVFRARELQVTCQRQH